MHSLRRLSGALILLVSFCSCVVIPESSFDQDRYLDQGHHSPSIYTAAPSGTYLPIFHAQPHENVRGRIVALLLVEFLDHPRYYMIELQEVVDQGHSGMIALLYHHANTAVDIYYTPGLVLDPVSYQALLNTVWFAEVDFDAGLTMAESGLQAHLELHDRFGDPVSLVVQEDRRVGASGSRGILAPIASGSEQPDRFPFIYLKGFELIPIRNTRIDLQIGSYQPRIDRIPALVNWRRVYNGKYSFDNVMVDWNKNRSAAVAAVEIEHPDAIGVDFEGSTYFLTHVNGFPEVEQIVYPIGDNSFTVVFSPPFPDLTSLADQITVPGRFSIQVDENEGIMGGRYQAVREGNVVHVALRIEEGWQPMPGPLWMTRYQWSATVSRTVSPTVTTEWHTRTE